MLEAYSVEQVRRAEAALMAELPEGGLMQRAVAGLAAECVRVLRGRRTGVYGARVVVVAGSGDNGGDALFAAAALARRGAAVTAVVLDEARVHGPALAALRAAGGRVVTADRWPGRLPGEEPDLVLDGVVGIGGRGALRPAAERVFELVEDCDPRPVVLAVDVPSGVDSDTGEVAGAAVRADVTVTFGVCKPGLFVSPGAGRVGECRFVDIGLESYVRGAPVLEALEAADVAELQPRPARESNKYRRGVVGVVAGSTRYPGAAVLSVGAALRSGVGAVRYLGPEDVAARVLDHYPEVLVSTGAPQDAGRVQAWVVGPGLGTDAEAVGQVEAVLAEDVPVLVDADALSALAQLSADRLARRTAATVLTPHAGEASRLLGGEWTAEAIESRRLAAVRVLAEKYGCTVLLKGSTTLVAEAGRAAVRVNLTGTPALATAGSGDVLSGLVGGLLAAGLNAFDAASAGAWRHGTAGVVAAGRTPDAVTAMDVLAALGRG
jgi:ADP-dependent NAD(P)H-hydrate dehydratase / NAD(P)H-hydrate epimerase